LRRRRTRTCTRTRTGTGTSTRARAALLFAPVEDALALLAQRHFRQLERLGLTAVDASPADWILIQPHVQLAPLFCPVCNDLFVCHFDERRKKRVVNVGVGCSSACARACAQACRFVAFLVLVFRRRDEGTVIRIRFVLLLVLLVLVLLVNVFLAVILAVFHRRCSTR
jgi:hypothetical protein